LTYTRRILYEKGILFFAGKNMRPEGHPFSDVTSQDQSGPYKTPGERAYYELKSRILTCQLSIGSRVQEKPLAGEIGTTPDLLRHACRRLMRERLIREDGPQLYSVAPFTVADIRELSEMGRTIESRVASLAAERVRPYEIARLLILAELSYQPGDRKTYMRYLLYNTAFHRQLAHAARNSRLETTVASVLDQVQRPLYLGLDVGLDPMEATAEHLDLVDAVRHKRPAMAARLMWDHITASEKRMIEAYADNGFA
jgi:DNA-binding GntR family transcriptional regulator